MADLVIYTQRDGVLKGGAYVAVGPPGSGVTGYSNAAGEFVWSGADAAVIYPAYVAFSDRAFGTGNAEVPSALVNCTVAIGVTEPPGAVGSLSPDTYIGVTHFTYNGEPLGYDRALALRLPNYVRSQGIPGHHQKLGDDGTNRWRFNSSDPHTGILGELAPSNPNAMGELAPGTSEVYQHYAGSAVEDPPPGVPPGGGSGGCGGCATYTESNDPAPTPLDELPIPARQAFGDDERIDRWHKATTPLLTLNPKGAVEVEWIEAPNPYPGIVGIYRVDSLENGSPDANLVSLIIDNQKLINVKVEHLIASDHSRAKWCNQMNAALFERLTMIYQALQILGNATLGEGWLDRVNTTRND